MKYIIICLIGFSLSAQCQTITWYDNFKAFKINSDIHYGQDTSLSPNYLWANYHLVTSDSTYQAQFIMYDSLDKRLLPTKELLDSNWRSSGTVKEYKLNTSQMNWTDLELRDSLIYPNIQNIFGSGNVTKLY